MQRPASQITPEAVSYPFIYSIDDRIDLGRMLEWQSVAEMPYPDKITELGSISCS